MTIALITIILLGVIIGSFLSVCIYRIPIQHGFDLLDENGEAPQEPIKLPDLSIGNPPRSFCPNCKEQLRWYHNIPVLSWLILGGKCAFCKNPISVRYPSVELLSALFASLSFLQFGMTWTALVVYVFCASLLVISFIDYDFLSSPMLFPFQELYLDLLSLESISGCMSLTLLFLTACLVLCMEYWRGQDFFI